ncbi:KxYKxGKxW signal peptide domain-containing protein, partial [Staphylococcus microti]
MTRKSREFKKSFGEEKNRVKLYKSGKNWVKAGVKEIQLLNMLGLSLLTDKVDKEQSDKVSVGGIIKENALRTTAITGGLFTVNMLHDQHVLAASEIPVTSELTANSQTIGDQTSTVIDQVQSESIVSESAESVNSEIQSISESTKVSISLSESLSISQSESIESESANESTSVREEKVLSESNEKEGDNTYSTQEDTADSSTTMSVTSQTVSETDSKDVTSNIASNTLTAPNSREVDSLLSTGITANDGLKAVAATYTNRAGFRLADDSTLRSAVDTSAGTLTSRDGYTISHDTIGSGIFQDTNPNHTTFFVARNQNNLEQYAFAVDKNKLLADVNGDKTVASEIYVSRFNKDGSQIGSTITLSVSSTVGGVDSTQIDNFTTTVTRKNLNSTEVTFTFPDANSKGEGLETLYNYYDGTSLLKGQTAITRTVPRYLPQITSYRLWSDKITPVADDFIQYGWTNDNYTTKAIDIPGYKYVTVAGNEDSIVSTTKQKFQGDVSYAKVGNQTLQNGDKAVVYYKKTYLDNSGTAIIEGYTVYSNNPQTLPTAEEFFKNKENYTVIEDKIFSPTQEQFESNAGKVALDKAIANEITFAKTSDLDSTMMDVGGNLTSVSEVYGPQYHKLSDIISQDEKAFYRIRFSNNGDVTNLAGDYLTIPQDEKSLTTNTDGYYRGRFPIANWTGGELYGNNLPNKVNIRNTSGGDGRVIYYYEVDKEYSESESTSVSDSTSVIESDSTSMSNSTSVIESDSTSMSNSTSVSESDSTSMSNST